MQANLYASWSVTEGFGVHWDDHDTVVIQLDGAKRWWIYGTTRPFPLYRDIEDPGEAPAGGAGRLRAGPAGRRPDAPAEAQGGAVAVRAA